MKRRKLIHNATALGLEALALEPLATLLEALGDSEPTPIPARVGKPEIKQIRTATRAFDSRSATYGPGLGREAVMGQLRWSAGLLKATCPDRLRPELHSAVGGLAETAGYSAQNEEEARRVFRFALGCAERAKDWNLRAEVLSSMAKQAIWTGKPDEGLTLAELALVRADRLTPTGRAVLHVDRGRALATMRRVQETLTAIGTADEHFAHSTPDNEPPCMAYYNIARHAQCTGQALVDLAILGR
ncbi:MAG: XRE family transcriptional regulator, partial [Pseudonocardiaceae bacterium]